MDVEPTEKSNDGGKRPSTHLLGKNPKVTLIRLVLMVTLLLVVSQFVLLPRRIDGVSMSPLFPPGKIILINKLAYMNQDPQRGDIVGIRTTGETILYIKRVVGLPGETVSIQGGQIFVDGKELDEPYAMKDDSWNLPERTLSEGVNPEYFFVGDNRSMDQDWHVFGVVKRDKLIGKVF